MEVFVLSICTMFASTELCSAARVYDTAEHCRDDAPFVTKDLLRPADNHVRCDRFYVFSSAISKEQAR